MGPAKRAPLPPDSILRPSLGPLQFTPGTGSPCRFLARSDYAFMFHCFALLFYVRTWMWHMSEAAAVLPGAQGFGWFFRWVLPCGRRI